MLQILLLFETEQEIHHHGDSYIHVFHSLSSPPQIAEEKGLQDCPMPLEADLEKPEASIFAVIVSRHVDEDCAI